jgi:hypothetical protein
LYYFFGVRQPNLLVVLTMGSAVNRTPTSVGLDHSFSHQSNLTYFLAKITVVKMDYSSHLINIQSS